MTTTPDEPIRVTVETVEQVYGYGEWRTVPVPSLYQQAFGKEEPIETERGDKGAATSATPIGKSIEEILRPLAEAMIDEERRDEEPFPRMVRTLDPRFEAMRAGRYQEAGGGSIPGWRIDASLEAIVRAAAACGLSVHLFHPARWPQGVAAQEWTARLSNWKYEEDVSPSVLAEGAPPEEAAARALVAAWNDEKRRAITK